MSEEKCEVCGGELDEDDFCPDCDYDDLDFEEEDEEEGKENG